MYMEFVYTDSGTGYKVLHERFIYKKSLARAWEVVKVKMYPQDSTVLIWN